MGRFLLSKSDLFKTNKAEYRHPSNNQIAVNQAGAGSGKGAKTITIKLILAATGLAL